MRTEPLVCSKLLDIMETKPYTQIRVSELVKEAGVSRSSFYFYFDSIETVLHKVEDDLIATFPTPDKLSIDIAYRKFPSSDNIVSATTEKLAKNLRTFRILSGPNGSLSFHDKMYDRVRRIIFLYYGASGISKKYLEMMTAFLAGSQWELYRWWANHEDEITQEEVDKNINRIYSQLRSSYYEKKPENT